MSIIGIIQEAHPLKQGLKHFRMLKGGIAASTIQEAHPLKQGLKLKKFIKTQGKREFKRHIH